MTLISYFVYCVIGRTFIFFLQEFPTEKFGSVFKSGGFLHGLIHCDMCLGVYVFTFLSVFFGTILRELFYVPVISELFTGTLTSLIVHLVRLGFEAKFSVIEVK